jgi:TM2 domain-containing membrane protein YozV
MDDVILMKGMTDAQRSVFMSEMNKVRKDRTTALLLALFLGGLGAHHYYLGRVGLGILCTVFFWTFIPAIVALVELFFIGKRVDAYNEQKAVDTAARVKMLIDAKMDMVTA